MATRSAWQDVHLFVSSTFRDTQAERDVLVRRVFPVLRAEMLQHKVRLIDIDLRWGIEGQDESGVVGICMDVLKQALPRFIGIIGDRYGWIPSGSEVSVTEQEIMAALNHSDCRPLFLLRNPARPEGSEALDFLDDSDAGIDALAKRDKLQQLRSYVKSHQAAIKHDYSCSVDGNRILPDTNFEKLAKDGLRESLTSLFQDVPSIELSPSDTVGHAFDFASERSAEWMHGLRDTELGTVSNFLKSGGGHLHIYGEGGSGKTSVIAKAVDQFLDTSAESDMRLLAAFCGAHRGAETGDAVFRGMAGQLAASIEEELEGDDHSQIPADYDSLCTWFERRISETRTAIVIDAIDQLPERDRFLSWLPNPLPNGVTLITGSLESNATAPLNDYWMSRATERMCLSPLDALAGGHLVNRSLARYQKTLSHDAMAALLVKPGATTPLYLRIASEELRTKGIREELVNEIAGMPGTAGGMFLWVLKRLASDPQFRWSNGTRAVDSLIGCLGVARDGLSESELVALIKHEDAFGADPEGDIAVLLQLLRPYMGRRGDRYTPVHRTFIDALHGGGLSDHDRGLLGSNHPAPLDESTEVKAAHRRLAVLFGSLPRSDTRRLAEETWHVIKSGDFKTANALLTDFDFLKKRVEAGLVRSVVEDMDCFVQEASNSEWPVTDDLRIWQRLFRRRRAFWEQFPDEFHQDCLNEAEGLPTTDAAKKNPIGKPWIRWLNKPEQEIRHPWEWMVRDASCAVFSPDGKSVAVGGTDGSLRLFDAKTGYEVWRGLAHSDRVDYVAFCPDARKVISSSKDSMSVVWDATVGRCLTKLCGHTDRVNFGEFCPDGVHAITTSNDKTIRVWELESGILQRTYQTNDGVIKVLRVSPDGNYIALAGSLGKICLISCSTWDYREFTAHAGDVTDINFSLDGCYLVTASRDRTAHVWLIPDMQRMVTINGHEDELTACCFNSDASQILTASRDGSVRLWDGLTGDELVRYTGHIGPVKSAKFSAESTTVITGSADKTSHIWNVEQQKCESILSGHESWVYDSSYHQGANRILTRSLETVRLWNTAGIVDFQRLNGHDGPVRTAVYTGDGTKVLTGSFDRTARLWDVNTGQLLQVYKGHDWYLWSAEFNADESLIVTSSFDGSARVWDTATGAEKCKLAGHTSAVRIARFSKDSQTVLTASEDSTVRTWNPVTGESKLILRGHDSYVYSATFDSHDQRVVTSSDDGTVQISTLSTEEQEPQSLVHPHWVHFAAPSPDDNLVVSVSKEKYVYLWDTPSGTMIENFQPKVQKIQNARFEGSNRIVCLGSLVSGEHLMDAETGEILSGQRLASLGCNVRSTVAMDAFGVGLTVYRPDTDIRILTHLESECIFNATVVCPTNPYSFTVGCADGSVRFFQLEGVELSEVSNI